MRAAETSNNRKKSTVRHTRAVQHDRSQRPAGAPSEEAIKTQLSDIVHRAALNQVDLFHGMGLRERSLTLPVMMALVLSLIWRQMGCVAELCRVINTEMILWVPPMKISQQGLGDRMRDLPAELFRRVLLEVLPKFRKRWEDRKRPVPTVLTWARERYSQVLICDGSTLDTVVRKTGLLVEGVKQVKQTKQTKRTKPVKAATNPLAGRIIAVLDLLSRLPVSVEYTDDETANDQRFWDTILKQVTRGALLIFDLGFTNYERFAQMTRDEITFITRARSNMAYKVAYAIECTANVHDLVVWIGDPDKGTYQQVRLIRALYRGKWYEYLTNELDAKRLPVHMAVDLYRQRWRIEDAFLITKSLLGLSYFFGGANNAICIQVWATWILYAVLVDLTDMVAEALARPFADISMEMVYRALPFYIRALDRGETNNLLSFLVARHKLYGLVKRKRSTTPSKTRLHPPLTDNYFP